MLGVLAIGTIWSLGYDWKIAAILYATAVALIVYLGVALWLIFGGEEEETEKKPAITTESEVKTDAEAPTITTEGEVKTDAEPPAITTKVKWKTDAETAKPEGLPQKRKPGRGSGPPRARS